MPIKTALLRWMGVFILASLVWLCICYVLPSSVQFLYSRMSQGLVTIFLVGLAAQAFMYSKPRKTIEDTSTKAVFITGCDSGFGYRLAETLAHMGFKVYAGCMDPSGVGPTSLAFKSDLIVLCRCDVTDEEQVRNTFIKVSNDLFLSNRSLWAVVNNAGIGLISEIEFTPLSAYRRLLEVNAIGPVMITKTFLPLLRDNGGRIVVVASLAGRVTMPGLSCYAMSKHAAVSFADGLRLEMKKWNISVHTVEPTAYRTPIVNVERLNNNVVKSWDESPSDVRDSYGEEYLEDFKVCVSRHFRTAKPTEKIHEVVDDMVDAVCGTDPQMRYVPSILTQLRLGVITSLPVELKDSLFLKSMCPSTPPARIVEKKKKKKISLQDPRFGPKVQRHYSVPNYEKNTITPNTPQIEPGTTKFLF